MQEQKPEQKQEQTVQEKAEQPKATAGVGRVPSSEVRAPVGSRADGSRAVSKTSDGMDEPEVYKADGLHRSLCVGYQKEMDTPAAVPIADVTAPALDD